MAKAYTVETPLVPIQPGGGGGGVREGETPRECR